MHAISCRDISKCFGGQQVLKTVRLEVDEGICFGLVGANGAGKSTLIKSMLDLISPDSGECFVSGIPSQSVASRRQLAYLPDRFVPPYYLKAIDFLDYMAELHGQVYDRQKLKDMLATLDLDESVLQKPVRQLSKGMTQKLGLAACFLSNKSLYVLDEPMSGLDPKARVLVKQQIKQQKQLGTTVFFSSHMLVDVEELADQMAVLHQGEVRFAGSVEAFRQGFNGATMEQAYLNCIGND
jgi:ABC-2 type transport system ATP-binding protein